jgi:hypothetical protein
MKTVLIISLALSSVSCAYYGTDKNGKPTGIMVATRAGKLAHNENGFYAENLDTQTGFKDAMDFGGTVAGSFFGYKTVTEIASTNAGVTNTETKTNGKVANSKEVTKRHAATQKTIQNGQKLEAEALAAPQP